MPTPLLETSSDGSINRVLVCVRMHFHHAWTLKIPTSLRKIICECRLIQMPNIRQFGRTGTAPEISIHLKYLSLIHSLGSTQHLSSYRKALRKHLLMTSPSGKLY